LEIESAQL